MKKEVKNWQWLGLGVFILYFLYNIGTYLPLKLFGIDYATMTLVAKVMYLLGYELLFLVILFALYKKLLIADFKDFIHNFKAYFKGYMKYWAMAFGLMIVSNFAIMTFFPSSIATNQEAINSIFEVAPIYMIISSVIFAPFLEETVFRLSFRKIFQNDTFFIIFSGLIFGAMHVIGSFTSWIDLVYIIPYSIPGWVFAYTLVKSKNIFVPMGLHFFHNGFTMLLQVILMFLI